MTLQLGTKLGPYEIVAPLGAGGMGEVYRAKDTRLKRDVAIKVVPEHLATDRDALNRFEREAQAIAALSHPNILAIHDVGTDPPASPLAKGGERGVSYVVMELLEGETLRERLRGAALSWHKAAEIGGAISEGLAAAHGKGVIHRDLKPENIFLTKAGVVKILDFGLARMEKPAPGKDQADLPTITIDTKPGAVMGTPAYMSPEQVRGEPADARSDIFAFGCVLYEMVTGNRAFAHKTPADITAAILKEEPPDITETAKRVPTEFDRVIRHCMEKKPEDRFQSARDLAFDLKAVLSDSAGMHVPRSSTSAWILPAIVTVAAIAALFFAVDPGGWRQRVFTPATPESIDSLAILPFVNAGNDPDTEYLCEGIPATIISSFSRLAHVRVVPWDTASRFKGREEPSSVLGRELKVAAVLTGKILARGDDLTVHVELVNVEKEQHLWGDRYPRKLTDILEIEEDVAKKIAAALELELTAEDETRLAKRYTESPEAHMAYIKGVFWLEKRTEEGFNKAIDYFQEAIESDPTYALAYAGLAETYSRLSDWDIVAAHDACPKARAAAERALALDDDCAEAHVALAAIQRNYDWDFSKAETSIKRAIALKPGYAPAHHRYGVFLGVLGRLDEAKREIERAQNLDPLSCIINTNVGYVYYLAREYDRAVAACKEALELDTNFYHAHYWMAYAYTQQGKYDQAIAALKTAISLGGPTPPYVSELGRVYATAGREDEARKTLEELNDRRKREYIGPVLLANVYTALGEKEHAFDWLERAYEQRHDELLELKMNPIYDPLRGDPRFDDLLRRIGFEPDAQPQSTTEHGVARPADGKIRLAVRPFADSSPDPQEWFCDGITEELIGQLGRLHPEKLEVIGRGSSMHYKDSNKTTGQIGRELNVDYVLEGSTRRSGNRVRILAGLTQVSSEAELWREDYDDRSDTDVFDVQVDVARRITRSLAITLLPGQKASLSKAPTASSEAYQLYLRGRFHWNKRTEEGFNKALGYFQEAIERDGAYAMAHVGLAETWFMQVDYGLADPALVLPRVRAALQAALQVDPDLGEAHATLASMNIRDWKWSGAETEFNKAIELSPNYPSTYQWYSTFLSGMGRHAEALTAASRARELDPLSPVIQFNLGYIHFLARRYDDALAEFQTALELDPRRGWAYHFIGTIHHLRNEDEQAFQAYLQAFRAYAEEGLIAPELIDAYQRKYEQESLRSAYRLVLQMFFDLYSFSPAITGYNFALVGDKEETLTWLERAFEENDGALQLIKVQPGLDIVRDDPRYHDLLRRMGLPPDDRFEPSQPQAPAERIRLAVLPFENLGPADDEYFADGISDEIRSRLAAVRKLGVISRASAFQYKQTPKTNRQIGSELGVDYLIDGTIQWDKRAGGAGRVRIRPELTRVSDEMVLWSQPYDRVVEDIFEVQSDIAERVVTQLNVALLAPERKAIEARPTDNLEAYDAYIRGLEYLTRPDYHPKDLALAIEMFKRATALDPDFALAHASLSLAHSAMYHFGRDTSEACVKHAMAAASQARELQPDLGDVHLALAYYHYRCHRDYEQALEALAVAKERLPSDARILELRAFIHRRQGRFREALDDFKSAFDLDPKSATLAFEIGLTLVYLREHAEADRWHDRTIALRPDQARGYLGKCGNYCTWRGDIGAARAALESAPRSGAEGQALSRYELAILERDWQAALNELATAPFEGFTMEGQFLPKELLAARAHQGRGEPVRAREAYDSARRLLESKLRESPADEGAVRSPLGIALAGLGRKEEAIREAKRGIELFPATNDVLFRLQRIETLAYVYVLIGEYDAALDQMEFLLSTDSLLTVPILRLDPRWDPLRNHPRYQQLLRRHGLKSAVPSEPGSSDERPK